MVLHPAWEIGDLGVASGVVGFAVVDDDPDGEYARAEKQKLQKANQKRATGGRVATRSIANFFDDTLMQTGAYPTVKKAAEEFGVSTRTVQPP